VQALPLIHFPPGRLKARAVLFFLGNKKPAGSGARTPAINLFRVPVLFGKTFHKRGDKTLIVNASFIVELRQAGAVQIFINRKHKPALIEQSLLNAQYAEFFFFEYLLGFADKLINGRNRVDMPLVKTLTRKFPRRAKKPVGLFGSVELLYYIAQSKLHKPVKLKIHILAQVGPSDLNVADKIPVKFIFSHFRNLATLF
jgi:hypothetical protein